MPKSLIVGLAVSCLLVSYTSEGFAVGLSPQDPANIEKVRRQVGKIPIGDPVSVTLRDKTVIRQCLVSLETDGLILGTVPSSGTDRKVPYAEIDSVTRLKPGRLRTAISLGAMGGLLFGIVKVGSNTTKTVLAKVFLGSGLLLIAAGPHPPPPRCS